MTDHTHVWKKRWSNGLRTVFECVIKGCGEIGYPMGGGRIEVSKRPDTDENEKQQLHDPVGAGQDVEVPHV